MPIGIGFERDIRLRAELCKPHTKAKNRCPIFATKQAQSHILPDLKIENGVTFASLDVRICEFGSRWLVDHFIVNSKRSEVFRERMRAGLLTDMLVAAGPTVGDGGREHPSGIARLQ